MALPKIDVPQYTIQLPSTGESVKIRPFLVREQKQLLIAQNGDYEQQTDAVLDIVEACTFNKLQVTKLPAYDVEYLFLQIRSRSVGENIDVILTCNECDNKQDGKIDISAVGVEKFEGHASNVDLGNGIVLTLKDPDLKEVAKLKENVATAGPDAIIQMLATCIKAVWQAEEMYDAADYSTAELIEFVENLNPANLTKIESYFNSMPVLRHEIDFKCEKCGADNRATLEGLQSFFL